MLITLAIVSAVFVVVIVWLWIERSKAARSVDEHRRISDYFRKIVNEQNELITRFRPDGTFLFANQAYCKFVGKPEDEILGTTIFDDMPENERLRLREYFANFSEANTRDIAQNRLISKRGDAREFEWTNQCFFDDQGEIFEFQSVGRDVTPRLGMERELAESKARFEDLTNMASDWVWEMDKELRYSYFSENLLNHVGGVSLDQFLGRTPEELLDDKFEYSERFAGYLEDLKAHRSFRNIEYALMLANGKKLYRSLSGEPIFDEDGDFAGFRGVGRDITQRVENEELIKQHVEDLDRLNQQKNKFISILAHDLKNPFNVLHGYSAYVHENSDTMSNEEFANNIELINDSAITLYQLLQDLLAWGMTQMDRVELDLYPNSLRELADDATRSLLETAKQKEVELVLDVDEIDVTVDRNLMIAVIRNLTGNALKFTSPGDQVTLSATTVDDTAVFSVADTGVGMKPEAVDALFHLDQHRSTTGTSGETGTGLGLLLCKEYVGMHGGQISVESTLGEGTTFRITLPLKSLTQDTAPQQSAVA
jgi:PAS domain S-box-containing protein